MKLRMGVAAVLVISASACSRSPELLATLPGSVIRAHADAGRCPKQVGCPAVYRLRITNPTDRDAFVPDCQSLEAPQVRPVTADTPAGTYVKAHATRAVSFHGTFP
jgi:hypothetical protein